jgi:Type II secretion system (T2SS), protein E, N-terminal domain
LTPRRSRQTPAGGLIVSESTLEEFLAIVTRDLGAESTHVLPAAESPPEEAAALHCDLAGGRRLVVRFAAPPADAAALQRRLEMLASAFTDILPGEGRSRASRPPPARSLREELAALVQRAGAIEAVIIDGHSPVVWGSASDEPEAPAPAVLEELRAPAQDHVQAPEQADATPKPPHAALHSVGPEDVAAVQYGLASAQGVRVDPGAMAVVPRAVCARHRILPVARTGDRLVIAMADPRDADAVYDVVLTTGLDVEPVFAGESMAAFFQHLDDGGDTRTYDDVMAAIPADARAAREDRARRARDTWARTMLTRRALAEVRALSELEGLRKGGHVRHMATGPGFGCVARSFAAIYVLILVFDNPFDELLAKRAVAQALPTIERLVAALPPLDPPPPTAGVAAMRGRRRR